MSQAGRTQLRVACFLLPEPSTGHDRATERLFGRTFGAIPVPLSSRYDRPSGQPADHTGVSAQNHQICVAQFRSAVICARTAGMSARGAVADVTLGNPLVIDTSLAFDPV